MEMNREEAKQVLCDLLAVKSVNHCDDEGKVAEYLKNYFAEVGVESTVQRIDDTHANFIVHIPGVSHDRHILWNGHMDTVPYGECTEWNTDPSVPTERDGRIYARGASDMKSGLAAMAYTLAEIVRSGKKPAYDITFTGTCDEEKDGLGVRALLREGYVPEVKEVLIGEPTGLHIGVAQKGCLWLEFEVHGKTSHGAYPEQGVNAVDYAVQIASRLKEFVTAESHEILGYATAQITEISGGVAPNMTPDRCKVLMDMRLVPGQTKEKVLRYLEEVVSELREKTSGLLQVETKVKNNRMAVSTDVKDAFTLELRHYIQKQGIEPENIGINYFTDGSLLLEENPELKILLFGAGEADVCHKANEYVILEKYYKSIEILTSYALNGFEKELMK